MLASCCFDDLNRFESLVVKLNMSSCNSRKYLIFTLFFPAFILSFVTSVPVPTPASPYDTFIQYLLKNNCTMPKELKLPFSVPSDSSPFDYLSTPLSECGTSEANKEYSEANMLCTEVFDVLKNITCVKHNESLRVIESDHLSKNVCHDFKSLKDIFPKKDSYLSKRLSDNVICKVLCTPESYELLCKTLLWSYDVLMKIKEDTPPDEVHKTETAFVGSNIQLKCLVSGSLPLEIAWSKDSGPLPDNAKVIKNELWLQDVRSDNAGSYECIAKNAVGHTTDYVILDVKDTLPSEVQEDANGSINKDSSVKAIPSLTQSSNDAKSESSSQNVKQLDKSKIIDNSHLDEKHSLGSNLSQTDQEPHNLKTSSEFTSEAISSKKESLDPNIQDEATNKTNDIAKDSEITTLQNKSELQNLKLTSKVSENNVKLIESKNVSNLTLQPEHMHDNENNINVDEKLSKQEVSDDNPQTNFETSSLTSNIKDGLKDNQNIKNVTADNVPNDKNDVNSNVGEIPSGKSEESVIPATGNDNELKNNNFLEEDNKSKTKQTDLENLEVKETEKNKQTDYEGPNEVLPDGDSKLPESSTQLALPDEDIEHQEDKDQDQYNNSFNLPSKNKESEVKNSIVASSDQMMSGYDSNISPKNNIARMSEEIAMIAPFPEQEDGHFFFYFLSIVLIIMAGYLIFHNKQKIIALIVEGRHERRRRSHGAGYKKLETK